MRHSAIVTPDGTYEFRYWRVTERDQATFIGTELEDLVLAECGKWYWALFSPNDEFGQVHGPFNTAQECTQDLEWGLK